MIREMLRLASHLEAKGQYDLADRCDRVAGYSTDLGMLRQVLKEGYSPYDYENNLPGFLDRDFEDVFESPNWFDNATPEQLEQFRIWNENHQISENDPISAPAYENMDYEGISRPMWQVHFTDDPGDIASQGFKYGHPEIEGIALTTWKKNRTKEGGFNFSFDADRAPNKSNYGKHAVIFPSGAVQAYHHGDEEHQNIFWGPTVDPRMIFPVTKEEMPDYQGGYTDDFWVIRDWNDRPLFKSYGLQDCVGWIDRNWRQLLSTREKTERMKTASSGDSRWVRLASPHGEAPPEYQPRVVRREDLEEDPVVMYHATNDLPGVKELGLVSQRERQDWNWDRSMGIGGGTKEYVSLTRDRKIAEDIAHSMRVMRDVVGADTPQDAITRVENAVREMSQKAGVDPDRVVNEGRRMLSKIWFGNHKGDPKLIQQDMDDIYAGLKDSTARSFNFPLPEELPEGSVIVQMWPHGTPGKLEDERPRVWKWKEPMTRDEWTFAIAHYFDYLTDELQRLGGPTSPMFFGFDESQFQFDPKDVGVAEVAVSGPPDRGWDKDYYPDWRTSPSALGEWAGHPDKTRVIL